MYFIIFENEDFRDINYFNNFHSFLINNNFELHTRNKYLELIIGNTIYKIEDEEQINLYRKTDILPENKYITKFNIVENDLNQNNDTTEYDFSCTLKNEELIEDENKDFDINNELKIFVMKKELIYKNSKSDVSYKCEILNVNDLGNISFKDTSLNLKNPKYIFKVFSEKEIVDVDYYIREMHFILDNNILPIKKNKQEEVLKNYQNLINSMLSKRLKTTLENDIVILAPKPATLEKFNLEKVDDFNSTSIFENYAVTEKADGTRFLMYVDNDSNVYLIDVSTKKVMGCNIKTSSKNCLLDGELILCQNRISDNNKDLFAIFDIYYYDGKKKTSDYLIDTKKDSRYSYMNLFLKSISEFISHNVIVKKQLISDKNNNILDKCNEILDNPEEYDYNIDGLIFTPIKIPVFGVYSNKPVEIENATNMSWAKVLKWKPPEQNTIDFIVKELNIINHSDGKKYKEYGLYLVYNLASMEPISVKNGLEELYGSEQKIKNTNFYELREFEIENKIQKVLILIDDNKCFTKNNEEIVNNSVVEFAYDIKTPLILENKRWIPLRIRHDKNKIYNFGLGEINKTANSYFVAMNIWRSITNEVSQEMICGKIDLDEKNITKYLSSQDKYYTRNINSANLISNSMNQFHNHIIKDYLYKVKIISKSKSLLELACGQGADLNRWIHQKFKYVLGIDYVLDNITNPKSGIYSRYINSNYKNDNQLMLFAAGDCSKSIQNGKCSENIDIESKKLLIHLFQKPQLEFNNLRNTRTFPNKFDLISCMFSLHYFYENEEKLNGFIQNIVQNIKDNGKIILTFMDKDLVNNILTKYNGRAIGKDPISNATVWAIIQDYNKHQKSIYNRKINVFIENTGKLIPENLVDLNVLISKLSLYNIKLIETETFQETFNKKKNEDLSKREKDIINNLDNNEILKEFSFLNRWVVFQKSI